MSSVRKKLLAEISAVLQKRKYPHGENVIALRDGDNGYRVNGIRYDEKGLKKLPCKKLIRLAVRIVRTDNTSYLKSFSKG